MASGCEEEWIASTLYCKLFQHTELASLRCCVLASLRLLRPCVLALLRSCVPACVDIVVHLASMTVVADPPSMPLHPIPHHLILLPCSTPLYSTLLLSYLFPPLEPLFFLELFLKPAPLYILKIVFIIFRFTNHTK